MAKGKPKPLFSSLRKNKEGVLMAKMNGRFVLTAKRLASKTKDTPLSKRACQYISSKAFQFIKKNKLNLEPVDVILDKNDIFVTFKKAEDSVSVNEQKIYDFESWLRTEVDKNDLSEIEKLVKKEVKANLKKADDDTDTEEKEKDKDKGKDEDNTDDKEKKETGDVSVEKATEIINSITDALFKSSNSTEVVKKIRDKWGSPDELVPADALAPETAEVTGNLKKLQGLLNKKTKKISGSSQKWIRFTKDVTTKVYELQSEETFHKDEELEVEINDTGDKDYEVTFSTGEIATLPKGSFIEVPSPSERNKKTESRKARIAKKPRFAKRRKKADNAPKWEQAYLIGSDGGKYSAAKGDYFLLEPGQAITDTTLVLIDFDGNHTEIPNPTIEDLPELSEYRSGNKKKVAKYNPATNTVDKKDLKKMKMPIYNVDMPDPKVGDNVQKNIADKVPKPKRESEPITSIASINDIIRTLKAKNLITSIDDEEQLYKRMTKSASLVKKMKKMADLAPDDSPFVIDGNGEALDLNELFSNKNL